MSAHPCPKCGHLRKVDVVFDEFGWQQPSCNNCGDPGYHEPFENLPDPEPTYFKEDPEDGVERS